MVGNQLSNSISLVNAGLPKVAIVCVIDIKWTGLREPAGKNTVINVLCPVKTRLNISKIARLDQFCKLQFLVPDFVDCNREEKCFTVTCIFYGMFLKTDCLLIAVDS